MELRKIGPKDELKMMGRKYSVIPYVISFNQYKQKQRLKERTDRESIEIEWLRRELKGKARTRAWFVKYGEIGWYIQMSLDDVKMVVEDYLNHIGVQRKPGFIDEALREGYYSLFGLLNLHPGREV